MEDKPIKKQSEPLISTQGICNEVKVHKYYRDFINKKYKGQKMTMSEWKKNLKKDGLDI